MDSHTYSPQTSVDVVAVKLQSIAHTILVGTFGILPIIFIPLPAAPLEYTKVLFVMGGILIALIFYSLSVLRSGKISYGFSYAFCAIWIIAIVTGISALLSGDLHDGLIGNEIGTQTVSFVVLLALSMSVWTFIGVRKESIMRLFVLLIMSTLLLVVFHVLRLFVGADMFSLGVFQNVTSSPIGGWNDLALFLGLTILLSLVTLEQLPLTKSGRVLFFSVSIASLVMLAIINFFIVWVVLGIVSLVMLVYSLGRERLLGISTESSQPTVKKSTASIIIPVVVFIVSALFVVGGTALGNIIGNATNVSYIEVRPSVSATAGIAKEVYKENAFFGIGTNKFADAWRLYKDASINQTVFWNTEFKSGSGYIPTFFVTNGVLGVLAWLTFLGLFVVRGVRMLFGSGEGDKMWYFIGTTSFVGAVYIWGMSITYVPGAAVLLIGALFTGLTFAADTALHPQRQRTLSLGVNRRTGFLLTLVVMIVIISSVGTLYSVVRHYTSTYIFANSALSVQPGVDLEVIENQIVSAFALSENDAYARKIAEYQLARMNSLLSVAAPTEDQQQQFQNAIANGVNAARLATERDGSDPANWAILGNIYMVLAGVNIEGSYDLAKEAFENAQNLDPKNPIWNLSLAQLEARVGNLDSAREFAQEAVAQKANYGDAIFFLSQVEIAMGDVDAAIVSTKATISLDPQNASRYYQLGVLESSRKNIEAAAAAFELAVRIDGNYANARYFLALAYNDLGRPEDAKVQLEKVLELNPNNSDVNNLVEQLEANGSLFAAPAPIVQLGQPVNEQTVVTSSGDDVTTTEAPDTSLVIPVNTPPATNIPAEKKITGDNSTKSVKSDTGSENGAQ